MRTAWSCHGQHVAAVTAGLRSLSAVEVVSPPVFLQAVSSDAFKRQQAKAAAAVLQEQIAAKAAKDAAERELYANRVTEGYFQQFGTSHR